MREIRRSALVPYSAIQMFDLVADVERYPEFLPWCAAARVLDRAEDRVTASLAMKRAGVEAEFTTVNSLVPGESLEMRLLEGPFNALSGRWDFAGIGSSGCRVNLEMRFETRNSLAGLVLAPAFESVCNQLVDAFVRRARSIYG